MRTRLRGAGGRVLPGQPGGRRRAGEGGGGGVSRRRGGGPGGRRPLLRRRRPRPLLPSAQALRHGVRPPGGGGGEEERRGAWRRGRDLRRGAGRPLAAAHPSRRADDGRGRPSARRAGAWRGGVAGAGTGPAGDLRQLRPRDADPRPARARRGVRSRERPKIRDVPAHGEVRDARRPPPPQDRWGGEVACAGGAGGCWRRLRGVRGGATGVFAIREHRVPPDVRPAAGRLRPVEASERGDEDVEEGDCGAFQGAGEGQERDTLLGDQHHAGRAGGGRVHGQLELEESEALLHARRRVARRLAGQGRRPRCGDDDDRAP